MPSFPGLLRTGTDGAPFWLKYNDTEYMQFCHVEMIKAGCGMKDMNEMTVLIFNSYIYKTTQ